MKKKIFKPRVLFPYGIRGLSLDPGSWKRPFLLHPTPSLSCQPAAKPSHVQVCGHLCLTGQGKRCSWKQKRNWFYLPRPAGVEEAAPPAWPWAVAVFVHSLGTAGGEEPTATPGMSVTQGLGRGLPQSQTWAGCIPAVPWHRLFSRSLPSSQKDVISQNRLF